MSMTAGKSTSLFCCYFSICVCAYPHAFVNVVVLCIITLIITKQYCAAGASDPQVQELSIITQ